MSTNVLVLDEVEGFEVLEKEEEVEDKSKSSSLVDIIKAGAQFLIGGRSRSGSKAEVRSRSTSQRESLKEVSVESRRASIIRSRQASRSSICSEAASKQESLLPKSSSSSKEVLPRSRKSSVTHSHSEEAEEEKPVLRSRSTSKRLSEVKRLSTATNISEDTIAQITDIEEDTFTNPASEPEVSLETPEICQDNGKGKSPRLKPPLILHFVNFHF